MIDYPEGMPRWAPGAADYLASILEGDEVGFEWGGGASSIWLAPKIRYLYVMETNEEWATKILEGTSRNNCGLWVHYFEDLDYLQEATKVKPRPNLWLIDGFNRIGCIKLVERDAREGDLVVLDDALDYAEHLLEGDWEIERFAMPHPNAGIPINHAKYGILRNTVRKVHADTKETWVCLV